MASNSASSSHQNDLVTFLTAEERSELMLLVGRISERMEALMVDRIDAPITTGRKGLNQVAYTSSVNPNIASDEDREETGELKYLTDMREKREQELSTPELLALKRDAVQFFVAWRDSLISRIGSVMNDLEVTVKETKESPFANTATGPGLPLTKIGANLETNVEESDAALLELYPPISTPLYSLSKNNRILLLHSMLLLVLSLEHYCAHSRILLLHVSSSLHLHSHILVDEEVKLAQGLLEAAKHMSGNVEAEKRSEDNKLARRWKVGLAGLAGAAVIGVTGGLAAPLVAAGVGAIMGGFGLGATTAATLLGALAESGVIVGSLFGAYGAKMGGKMMDAYAKEVEDFAFLPLRGSSHNKRMPENQRLRLTIGVSVWLTQKEDIITPWRVLGHKSEVFALRWELETLRNLGTSMETVVKSAAWAVAKKEIISRTIFASLMQALWPISLLRVAKIIDNPFSVAKNRADKAGLVLADALVNKAQGERPVTLIGYSLGSRLIYSCLMSLAERRAFGLVENVVLIGSPCPSDTAVWRRLKSVVAGRLVNVYSDNDYILAFLYRTSSIQYGIAGLQNVQDVEGVENVNVSDIVSGHLRYQYLMGIILRKIRFEDVDVEEVAKEEETAALLEKNEEKEQEKQGREQADSGADAMSDDTKR